MDNVELLNDSDRVGSFLLAEGLGREHGTLKAIIEKYLEDFECIDVLKKRKLKSTGGRAANEYMLSYNQVVFLVSLIRNNKQIVSLASKIIIGGAIVSAVDLLRNFDADDIADRYVYAAVDEQQRVKIGISSNPENRIKQLNIGNADKLSLVFTRKAIGCGYSDETNLHLECSDFKIRSEWFTQEAMEVINANR